MSICTGYPWTDCVTSIGTAIGAFGTVVTAGVAWYIAATWRQSLSHSTAHDVATKVLEDARLFRYLFYDARNPFYGAGEFPAVYSATRDRTAEGEAFGWMIVYQHRWKLIEPQVLELAKLRARAGAVLGEDVATAIEQLAKKGRELQNFMDQRVEQIRSGPEIVAMWPDQAWIERVQQSLVANPDPGARDDTYSGEFEERFQCLENLVRPFI